MRHIHHPAPIVTAYTPAEADELAHLVGGIQHALRVLRTVPYRQLAAIHVETARLLLQRIEQIACLDPDLPAKGEHNVEP